MSFQNLIIHKTLSMYLKNIIFGKFILYNQILFIIVNHIISK
jgi:hypothetical protein